MAPFTPTIPTGLTPQQLEITPAALPPPGVIPNFQHPATRISDVIGIALPFLVIATAFLSIRAYMKIAVLKKWRPEDSMDQPFPFCSRESSANRFDSYVESWIRTEKLLYS